MDEGRGLGLAAHRSFVSYIATVVEVEVSDGDVKIPRVDVAVDCGCYVNRRSGVRAQVEGACIMGLSNTMDSEITFDRGRVQQSNFHDYPFARINEAPRIINVHLIEAELRCSDGRNWRTGCTSVHAGADERHFCSNRAAYPGFADPQPA